MKKLLFRILIFFTLALVVLYGTLTWDAYHPQPREYSPYISFA